MAKHNGWAVAIIVAVFSAVYFVTLFDGIGGRVNFGDSAKWQYLWVTGGTPHSTGYPLFLALTYAFGHTLGFLEPWLRISLISLIFGIATLVGTWFLAAEIVKRPLARWLAVLLLGVNPQFWSQATEPEVYTLNCFFVVTVSWLALRYYATRHIHYCLFAVGIYALSFGNHLTMITLLPALAYLTTCAMPARLIATPRVALFTLLCVALSFSQYLFLLYLSYQDSPHLEFIGYRSTIGHWLLYITGGQFHDQFGNTDFWQSVRHISQISLIFFGWPFLVIGLATLWDKHCKRSAWITMPPASIMYLLIALVGQLTFILQYDIVDIEVYLLPVNLIVALLLAKTVDTLQSPRLYAYCSIVMMLTLLHQSTKTYAELKPLKNTRQDTIFRGFQALPTQAMLLNLPAAHGSSMRGYPGQQALNYAQFVAFASKQITVNQLGIERLHLTDTAYIFQEHLNSPVIQWFVYKPVANGVLRIWPKSNKSPYIFDFESHDITFSSWFEPEENHRWSNGNRASISFPKTLSPADIRTLHMGVSALGSQRVRVLLNGVTLDERLITGWPAPTQRWDIPPSLWQARSPAQIEFELLDARAPNKSDTRQLALALHFLVLE